MRKKRIWKAVDPPTLGIIEERDAEEARWQQNMLRWVWGVAAALVMVVVVTKTSWLSDVGLAP